MAGRGGEVVLGTSRGALQLGGTGGIGQCMAGGGTHRAWYFTMDLPLYHHPAHPHHLHHRRAHRPKACQVCGGGDTVAGRGRL